MIRTGFIIAKRQASKTCLKRSHQEIYRQVTKIQLNQTRTYSSSTWIERLFAAPKGFGKFNRNGSPNETPKTETTSSSSETKTNTSNSSGGGGGKKPNDPMGPNDNLSSAAWLLLAVAVMLNIASEFIEFGGTR